MFLFCPLAVILLRVAQSESCELRAMAALSPLDPSSFSRPELAIVKHISLNLNVDFNEKILSGSAVLSIDVLDDINEVILDVSGLKIESVAAEDGTELKFTEDSHLPNLGSKLTITLPNQTGSGEKLKLKIKYSTAPTASALQWLDPPQTSGKKYPYLFSQCQPIHARSIVPCQDSPAVKFTYDAEIAAPEEYTVLMSALRGEVKGNKTYFNQPMPLPAYLLAIAVGVLESQTIGPRSKVWAEKDVVGRSAWEFADTEKYLQTAEHLCGPYEWHQYDLLVMPPSFPYGGMENPCLTFVTPTLLAGDKSLANVIVHEIMHSWTGNLVTNRNFEHFWLNEGFTVFLERKVGAALVADPTESARMRDFQSILGLQELTETINNELGADNPYTQLVPDLKGVHPDDAFSRVPYEKGSLFLRYLEDLLGGPEKFDDFLRAYLTKYRKKSLDTDQFKAFLLAYFKDDERLKMVDWNTWFYKTGMPPVIPNYDNSKTKAVSSLVGKLITANYTIDASDVKGFCPHQMIYLLQSLVTHTPALPLEKVQEIGEVYNVSDSHNAEIEFRWLRLSIRSKDRSKLKAALDFVNKQGRMKYVRPLYRDLYAWEDVRQEVTDNFLANEKYMMHVTSYMLRKDLHISS